MKVIVVVGGQYGSEAKGHVTAQLVKREIQAGKSVANVRVAGPNAGHSVVCDDHEHRKHAFRQLPVAAVMDGPIALGLAGGSEIYPPVLFDEMDHALATGHRRIVNHLMIDQEATILTDDHIKAETGMHERIGSTGKGIGAARADRIMRTANRVRDDEEFLSQLHNRGVAVGSLEDKIFENGLNTVVIEGTQGYGLGLHAGHYPKCTSSDCRAIDFLAMVGISPWDIRVTEFEVWVVCRVFPIRVYGDSGYMAGETTWQNLNLPPEFTTVTHKIRRVGLWDPLLVGAAVDANGGHPVARVALTMLDQAVPASQWVTSKADLMAIPPAAGWIEQVGVDTMATVGMVTTSDRTAVFL